MLREKEARKVMEQSEQEVKRYIGDYIHIKSLNNTCDRLKSRCDMLEKEVFRLKVELSKHNM